MRHSLTVHLLTMFERGLLARCALLAMLAITLGSSARADEATCGALSNAFGPFDYRDPQARADSLKVVEDFHFTSEVENLVRGKSGLIPQDLDYTLRAFPNHHRALYSAVKYELGGGKGLPRTVDCYIDRAIRFRPDDATVYLVQGIFFSKSKRLPDAIKSYRRAIDLQGGLADAHYNLGLAYFETGDYSAANKEAQVAYRLGYPLPGLRDRLKRQGAWSPGASPKPPQAATPSQ